MSDEFDDENQDEEDLDFGEEEGFEEEDDFEFGEEEGFEEFQTESSTLGDMWRNNPLVKIGVVLAGFAAIFIGIALFGGGEDVKPSITPPAPQVKEAPGGKVSPAIEEAIREKNKAQLEEAQATGGTSIPIPIGGSKDPRDLEARKDSDADPGAQWRQIQAQRLAEQRQRRDTRERASETARRRERQEPDNAGQAVNQLAEAMQAQMQSIISEQKPVRAQQRQITDAQAYLTSLQEQTSGGQNAGSQNQNNGQGGQSLSGQNASQIQPEVLVPAGKIEFGQLLLEANTDAPGPVLAQILSGPLKGSRMIGSFETRRNFLVLNFNTIIVDDQSISTQAIAINPATNNPGIVTEIDRRYFSRVILPGAAAFVEGFGEAVSESGRTTITVDGGSGTTVTDQSDLDTEEELYAGVEEAAREFGDIIDEEADEIQPLLRIDAGTPIGIFFTSPVMDPKTVGNQNSNAPQNFQNQPGGQGITANGVRTQIPGQNAPRSQIRTFVPDQFINPELVNQSLTDAGISGNN